MTQAEAAAYVEAKLAGRKPTTETPTWEEHLQTITDESLSSAEGAHRHLALFAENVVAKGLAPTALAGQADIHGVIAGFLGSYGRSGCVSAPPNAKALRVIAKGKQDHLVAQFCAFLGAKAPKAAMAGKQRCEVRLYEQRSSGCWRLRDLPEHVTELCALCSTTKIDRDIVIGPQHGPQLADMDANETMERISKAMKRHGYSITPQWLTRNHMPHTITVSWGIEGDATEGRRRAGPP